MDRRLCTQSPSRVSGFLKTGARSGSLGDNRPAATASPSRCIRTAHSVRRHLCAAVRKVELASTQAPAPPGKVCLLTFAKSDQLEFSNSRVAGQFAECLPIRTRIRNGADLGNHGVPLSSRCQTRPTTNHQQQLNLFTCATKHNATTPKHNVESCNPVMWSNCQTNLHERKLAVVHNQL